MISDLELRMNYLRIPIDVLINEDLKKKEELQYEPEQLEINISQYVREEDESDTEPEGNPTYIIIQM